MILSAAMIGDLRRGEVIDATGLLLEPRLPCPKTNALVCQGVDKHEYSGSHGPLSKAPIQP